MDQFPLVSIIITSYNRSSMLPKAIESALAQDYPNLEIVVSDNCSTDGSDEIIKKYTGDARLVYSRNEQNIGMLPNFRKATYDVAKGEFITYVNCDDYLIDKSFITDSIKLVNKYENVFLVHGRMNFFSQGNDVLWEMPEDPYFTQEIWDGRDVFFKSVSTGLLSWGACLMKRSEMRRVGSLMSDYHNGDLDSNYRIMLTGKVAFVNRPCYLQIGHTDNAGFPVNAGKLITSLDCYDNVAKYANVIMPERINEIDAWQKHFIFYTVNMSFHNLYEKNKVEYAKFKDQVKSLYPEAYSRFFNSWAYKKMVILSPVKKILPKRLVKVFRSFLKKVRGS